MITLACIALGAALYRWRGHGSVSGPRWLKLEMMAAFLCLPLLVREEWVRVTAALPVAFAALSLGHGAMMDLAHTRPEKPHDRIGAYQEEPWLFWFARVTGGTILGSRYLHEFTALAISGLAATLGPGIALALSGEPWGGVALALAGSLKAPAYGIGWRLRRRWPTVKPTEYGEWLTGASWGAVVGLAL